MVSLGLSRYNFWSFHIERLSRIWPTFFMSARVKASAGMSESNTTDIRISLTQCTEKRTKENKERKYSETLRRCVCAHIWTSARVADICVNSWLCRPNCKWEFNWTQRCFIKPLGQAHWKSCRLIFWPHNSTLINPTILKDLDTALFLPPSSLTGTDFSSQLLTAWAATDKCIYMSYIHIYIYTYTGYYVIHYHINMQNIMKKRKEITHIVVQNNSPFLTW